jgi:hypothetical protein
LERNDFLDVVQQHWVAPQHYGDAAKINCQIQKSQKSLEILERQPLQFKAKYYKCEIGSFTSNFYRGIQGSFYSGVEFQDLVGTETSEFAETTESILEATWSN